MNPVPPPSRPVVVKPLPAAAYVRMSLVLRFGLGVALAILGSGLLLYLAVHPDVSSGSILASNPVLAYLSIGGLGAGLASGSVDAYLTLGLIALVATPILRVLSGFYYFRRAGERSMTVITFTVFVLLLFGLLALGPFVR